MISEIWFYFLFLIHLEGCVCVCVFSCTRDHTGCLFSLLSPRFIMSLPTHFINNPFVFIELNCPPCHTWICHIQRHLILGSLLCSTDLSIPLSKLNWLMILQDINTIQKNKTHIQTKKIPCPETMENYVLKFGNTECIIFSTCSEFVLCILIIIYCFPHVCVATFFINLLLQGGGPKMVEE